MRKIKHVLHVLCWRYSGWQWFKWSIRDCTLHNVQHLRWRFWHPRKAWEYKTVVNLLPLTVRKLNRHFWLHRMEISTGNLPSENGVGLVSILYVGSLKYQWTSNNRATQRLRMCFETLSHKFKFLYEKKFGFLHKSFDRFYYDRIRGKLISLNELVKTVLIGSYVYRK